MTEEEKQKMLDERAKSLSDHFMNRPCKSCGKIGTVTWLWANEDMTLASVGCMECLWKAEALVNYPFP